MSKSTIKLDVNQLVAIFNRLYPVGATVRWRSIGKGGAPFHEYTVQHEATNHNGMPVAWLRERTGMVCVAPEFVDYEVEANVAAS